MKVYYLKLTEEDFTKDGKVWTSGVVDLYDNESAETSLATPSYRNFSTIKSSYGTDRLGNSVWTGMYELDGGTPEYIGGTPESGLITNGRYIDYTGRIDLVDWNVNVTNAPGVGLVDPHLSVWHIDDLEQEFPHEWAGKEDITQDRAILITGAYRYARFELDIHTDLDITDIGVELLVRIRIEDPVQGEPLYARTRRMLDEFPEWMAIREVENVDHATPETATPDSLGGKLLSAVAGQWLNHIDGTLDYLKLQEYIGSANIDQVAWIYRTENAPEALIRVDGNGVELAHCADLEDFYSLTDDEDGFWYDVDRQIVYTRKLYDQFSINWDDSYTQTLQPVWNAFDDFGMAVDLPRLYNESNDSYKSRILDVYINFPGAGVESFKLALRRELNLWLTDGASPDSAYLGATPTVLEMQDIEQDSVYVTPDGLPTVRFRSLVMELANKYPSTWGFFVWNNNLWDTGGVEGEGYDVLPNVMDVDLPPVVQSGVGDGNDLYVFRPDVVTGPRNFELNFMLRGRARADRTEYREIKFDADVWLKATKPIYTNAEQTVWLTVEYTPHLATPTGSYYHSFPLNVTNDTSNGVAGPTLNSAQTYQFLDAAGRLIPGMIWYKAGTDDAYSSDGRDGSAVLQGVGGSAAALLKLHAGKYNPETQTFSDTGISGVAEAWFTDIPGTKLVNTTPITSTSGIANKVMAWSIVAPSINNSGVWESEKYRISVTLNGVVPDQTQQSFVADIPRFLGDPYTTSDYKYVVEIVSTPYFIGDDGQHQPLVVDLPVSSITLNGSAAWSDNKQEFVQGTTFSLIFASTTSSDPVYPYVNPNQWSSFEATTLVPMEGVVDENGPWRNGNAPVEGNSNFVLDYVELTREDFGVSDSDAYIPTWMGVYLSDGDDRIVVWIDTNTVKPSSEDSSDVVYPPDAIQEHLDTTSLKRYFSPIAVKAKLLPGPDLQWNPQVHSGWFYENGQEYYMFADPQTETATSAHYTLSGVARQGAPIVIEGYRQVANWDTASPSYGLTQTETITGNGTTTIYLGHDVVHGVVVTNLNTGENVELSYDFTSDGTITFAEVASDKETEYEVQYVITGSFFADNNYVDPLTLTQRTVLHFDSTPNVEVMYEGSKFDPAAPVDLPLNTFYTIQDEGYIFLSHEEYTLASTEVRLNPSFINADGEDYMLLTIRAFDTYGNPKPGASYHVTTDWGNFIGNSQDVIFVCNDDGFRSGSLYADDTVSATPGLIGSIHIVSEDVDDDFDETITFDIKPQPVKGYRLSAMVTNDMVPADGVSQNFVVGKVEDTSYDPVEWAVVRWNKGRYMKDVLDVTDTTSTATPGFAGTVVSDEDGYFKIGPFTSATPWDPGYWFVSARTDRTIVDYGSATPGAPDTFTKVGDAVAWLEYPDMEFGNEAFDDLPVSLVQWRTPAETATPYTPINEMTFPVSMDDEDPYPPATPVTPTWTPPEWYAIDRYTQYQMSLLGTDRFQVDYTAWLNSNPDYRDV
jgi:hypothetical protein